MMRAGAAEVRAGMRFWRGGIRRRQRMLVAGCLVLGLRVVDAQVQRKMSGEVRGGGLVASSSLPNGSGRIRLRPTLAVGGSLGLYPTAEHRWGRRLVADIMPAADARFEGVGGAVSSHGAIVSYFAVDGVRRMS